MKIDELIKLADDAYYATQYDKSIEYYELVLKSAAKNKHAQKQIRRAHDQLKKANYYRALNSPAPKIPIEALQLYRLVRSYIRADDLIQAKETLQKAISAAKNVGVHFKEAQDLLDNLQDAFNAKKFRQSAFAELEEKHWAKAVENLNSALASDPTDENNKTLLLYVENLLKALNLAIELQSGMQGTDKHADEIQKAIDDTRDLPILSTLRLDVVRQFGEYRSKANQLKNLAKNIAWSFLGAILLIALTMTLIYVLPQMQSFVDCSNIKDLEIFLSYPIYIANGDDGSIEITFKNVGQSEINGKVLIYQSGDTNVRFDKTKIELKNLEPKEQESNTITFSLDEPPSVISDPSQYIEFNIDILSNNSTCISNSYHIAISPIYKLEKVLAVLWTLFGLTLFGLVRDRIFKFIGLSK